MNVHINRAGQSAGRRRVEVGRAPASIPEVLRAVFVGYEEQRDAGAGRVDADGGGWEVLRCGGGEGFVAGVDEVGVGRVEGVGLWVGGFLWYVSDKYSVKKVPDIATCEAWSNSNEVWLAESKYRPSPKALCWLMRTCTDSAS